MPDGPDERAGEPAPGDGADRSDDVDAGTDTDDVDAGRNADDGDGGDDGTNLAARVAELERTVEALGGAVERQRRDISYLAAAADIDSVEPRCPDCAEGVLQRSSGLTWTQVSCPECGLKRYL